MNAPPVPQVIAVVGPTASGKTALAIELAQALDTEIVSADSMQVYRRLSIGTARPDADELGGVPYHLIDIIDPVDETGRERRFSAAEFLERARPIVERLSTEGRTPLVVGGTGLYLEALTRGLFDQPEIEPEVRRAVERELAGLSNEAAHARLAAVDPETAARVHPNDRVRVVRALEVHRKTGRPISDFHREHRSQAPTPHRWSLFVLTMPRAALYERIDRRVEAMFAGGLLDETRALIETGLSADLHCMKALGYSRVMDCLAGRVDRATALADVQRSHRNYAKRQLTWFRRQPGARWVDVSGMTPSDAADRLEERMCSTQK